MRKVLLLRTSGNLLGAERVILELAKHLPPRGYHPIIGIPYEIGHPIPEFAEVAENNGFEVALFPIKGAFDMSILSYIREFVQKHDVEIIHSHGYREDFYALFSKTNSKLVATNHLWKRTTFKLKLYALLDSIILNKFQSIIAVSEPVKADMLKAKVNKDKITVVSNGIDPDDYFPIANHSEIRESLNIAEDRVIVGTLSSLTIEKGLDYGIKAFSEALKANSNLHLLVVGSGEELKTLEKLTDDYSLGNCITFAGRRSDISDILSVMDVFMLPSLNEGLPMALLEAMAAGKAVIATSVGDVPKVVTSENGLLVEPADIPALSKAIKTLTSNREMIEQYGKAARQKIINEFSSVSMARSNADIYESLFSE